MRRCWAALPNKSHYTHFYEQISLPSSCPQTSIHPEKRCKQCVPKTRSIFNFCKDESRPGNRFLLAEPKSKKFVSATQPKKLNLSAKRIFISQTFESLFEQIHIKYEVRPLADTGERGVVTAARGLPRGLAWGLPKGLACKRGLA